MSRAICRSSKRRLPGDAIQPHRNLSGELHGMPATPPDTREFGLGCRKLDAAALSSHTLGLSAARFI